MKAASGFPRGVNPSAQRSPERGDQLGSALIARLLEDVRDVHLHRALGAPEAVRDFPVRDSLSDQFQDLGLAGRERPAPGKEPPASPRGAPASRRSQEYADLRLEMGDSLQHQQVGMAGHFTPEREGRSRGWELEPIHGSMRHELHLHLSPGQANEPWRVRERGAADAEERRRITPILRQRQFELEPLRPEKLAPDRYPRMRPAPDGDHQPEELKRRKDPSGHRQYLGDLLVHRQGKLLDAPQRAPCVFDPVIEFAEGIPTDSTKRSGQLALLDGRPAQERRARDSMAFGDVQPSLDDRNWDVIQDEDLSVSLGSEKRGAPYYSPRNSTNLCAPQCPRHSGR